MISVREDYLGYFTIYEKHYDGREVESNFSGMGKDELEQMYKEIGRALNKN